MKKNLLIILVVIAFGCSNNNVFTVKGHLSDIKNENSKIYIYRSDVGRSVLIDSSKINKRGDFNFRIKATETDFYQIGLSNDNFVSILAEPGEKIMMNFMDRNLFAGYDVTGSKGSELIRTLDIKLIKTRTILDSLNNLYNEITDEDPEKEALLEKEYLNIVKEQRKFNIEFIVTNITSLAAIKALYQRIDENTYVLYEPRDLQYLKITADSLKKYYPGSKHTKALLTDLENELDKLYARQIQDMAEAMPETEADPYLKDNNGNRIRLSSLKGKYVLLTFWSANSRECVADNLQLKEYYKLYNKKGFEIYQINLDADEELWKAAVAFDDLPWISTREDDPANSVNVRIFNVRTLPANYLFDLSGNIIASNLYGKNLQVKLNQIFTN